MPLAAGTVVGIEPPGKFRFDPGSAAGLLIQKEVRLQSAAALRDLSARAPPATPL